MAARTALDLLQTVAERLAAENRSIRGELEQYLARDATRQPNRQGTRGSVASRHNGTGRAGSPLKAVGGAFGGDNGGRGDRRESAGKGAWEGALQAQVCRLSLVSSEVVKEHPSGQLWCTRSANQ